MFSCGPRGCSLEITLGVLNTGDEEFKFQSLLHTYFRVPDIDNVKIIGFNDRKYQDHLGDRNTGRPDNGEDMTISEEVDREYLDMPQNTPIDIYTGDIKKFKITTKANQR